jgi:hypothetical protein
MSDYLNIAREIMRDQRTEPRPDSVKPLEDVLKGHAIELWSDTLGSASGW